jgi:hypothetical protein
MDNKDKYFDGTWDLNVPFHLKAVSKGDAVNSPSHYTNGSQEAIDIIEEAIDAAPSVQAGFLQAQVLKYLLRVWLKDNPLQDLKKAQWYLTRLIDSLE